MKRLRHSARPKGARCGRFKSSAALALASLVLVSQSSFALADIDNIAVAKGTYGGNDFLSAPDTEAVPVVPGVATLSVIKTADVTVNVIAGQVIIYSYLVTNTGNLTLTGITPSDAHGGSGPPPVPDNETLTDNGPLGDSTDATGSDGIWSVLAPGDSVTFTSTYTVTQSDVDTLQ